MNLQRYILPVTVAAAIHGSLLWVTPEGKITLVEKDKPTTCGLTPPNIEDNIIEPPPAEEPETSAVVKPISGGPQRPVLPDELTDAGVKDFTVPFERSQVNPWKVDDLRTPITPGAFGPGDPTGGPQKTTWAKFLDQPPRAKVQVSPDYPPALKHESITGVVTIEFDVDVKGRVVSARVLESTHRAFEEPTIRAVLKWRFEPGVSQGRIVPFRMQVPVNFKLGDNS